MWAEPGGGYAILLLLLLGAVGATMAPGGLRNRKRAPQRLLAAALLVGAASTLLWPSLRDRLASRRTATHAATPVGIWIYGVDTLSVDANGSYACGGQACAGFSQRGTWRLGNDGRLLVRWADGHEVSWRVVRYNGHERLGLTPSAGATWDSGLSFMRVSP